MTALEKVLAAFEADKVPAPSTVRDALTELDRHIAAAQEQARSWAVVRGKLEMQTHFMRVLGDVMSEVPKSAKPELAIVAPLAPTPCSECGKPARVWDGATPYCKEHGHARGLMEGKIT